jgi:hypothetical protein
MGRRSTIDGLPVEQFDFVIRELMNGATDRAVSAAFEAKFNKELPKSNLNLWRNKAGNELVERYKMRRFQIKEVVERLKDEGIEVEDDKYKHIIENLEDYLLTAERDLIAQNPVKLLFARQEEERLRLKREKLELDREQLAFDREKHRSAIDRVKLGSETLQDFIEYVDSDAEAITFLQRHLIPFGAFLKKKYAAEN